MNRSVEGHRANQSSQLPCTANSSKRKPYIVHVERLKEFNERTELQLFELPNSEIPPTENPEAEFENLESETVTSLSSSRKSDSAESEVLVTDTIQSAAKDLRRLKRTMKKPDRLINNFVLPLFYNRSFMISENWQILPEINNQGNSVIKMVRPAKEFRGIPTQKCETTLCQAKSLCEKTVEIFTECPRAAIENPYWVTDDSRSPNIFLCSYHQSLAAEKIFCLCGIFPQWENPKRWFATCAKGHMYHPACFATCSHCGYESGRIAEKSNDKFLRAIRDKIHQNKRTLARENFAFFTKGLFRALTIGSPSFLASPLMLWTLTFAIAPTLPNWVPSKSINFPAAKWSRWTRQKPFQ